jgi:hypothetical protein
MKFTDLKIWRTENFIETVSGRIFNCGEFGELKSDRQNILQ